jgi:integrase
MGRRHTSSGVEVRESSLRAVFTWAGKQRKETIKRGGVALTPTPANIKFSERLVAEIRLRIRAGNFSYAEFFPDSPLAEPESSEVMTFGKAAELWLESKGTLQAATKDQYGTALRFWIKLLGEDTPIASLTHQVLAAKVGGYPWTSTKAANNYLVSLRGLMGFIFHGPTAAMNPMVGIKNLKVVKKRPDPLSADERDRILAELSERYDKRVWAYFAFAFATGMRPEEIIALHWGDVDTSLGTVTVQRVRTFRGSERAGSKTHSERDVDLMPLAIEALAAMKPYTFLKGEHIFESPLTGEPWHDERSQRDTFWKPTLKRLGIRQRRAYATRHTYATVALMGGVNPAYIAAQLGHTNSKMLFETYSRWIESADKGAQRAAMAALLTAPIYPRTIPGEGGGEAKLLISNEKNGRRDWTRIKKLK